MQQHQLRIRATSGATLETGACVVVDVADGLITHTAEHVDSSTTAFAAQNGFGPG